MDIAVQWSIEVQNYLRYLRFSLIHLHWKVFPNLIKSSLYSQPHKKKKDNLAAISLGNLQMIQLREINEREGYNKFEKILKVSIEEKCRTSLKKKRNVSKYNCKVKHSQKLS